MKRSSRGEMERGGAVLSAWDKVYGYLLDHHPNTARADVLAAERLLGLRWDAEVEQRLLIGPRHCYTNWRPENLVNERAEDEAKVPKSMAVNIEAVKHILKSVSHLQPDEAWWAVVRARQEICNEYLRRSKKVA